MATTPTTNYGFSKITPGTEKDIWGPIQSTTLDSIDTQIKNRQNEAAAKLPLAGGTMTGKVIDLASAAVAGAGSNFPHGVAPNTPVNGDFWSTTAAFFGRINGTTVQLSVVGHTHVESDVTNLVSDLALKAPLASPPLTGTPTAPTASPGTNTTQIATTAFSAAAITAALAAASLEAISLVTVNTTLALTDAGKFVATNNAASRTLTVPLNATVAFPIGSRVDVGQYGAGDCVIAATGGVTIRSEAGMLKIKAQYSAGTLWKIGTDEWWLVGALKA